MELCRYPAIILFLLLLLAPVYAGATWQQTLESNFDIVDTFDDLQDWSHSITGYITNASLMPKKTSGEASIWNFYTTDFSHQGEPVIGDHGAGYTFNRGGSSTPKSFCLQHNVLYKTEDDAAQGQGVQRLGAFFGDGVTGKSGYKNIHVFFITKFRPGYWPFRLGSSTNYAIPGYLKYFDVMSGYTAPYYWGIAEERATTTGSNNVLYDYGTNGTVFNFTGGGDTCGLTNIFPVETTLTAEYQFADPVGWKYAQSATLYCDSRAESGSLNISSSYASGEWVGIEIRMDAGTVDTANGALEYWVYSQTGTVLGHYISTDDTRMVHFDHYFNNVVLGGNRSTNTGVDDVVPSDTRAYIDDFIIHDSRIGPTYFSLLGGSTPPSTGKRYSYKSIRKQN